MIFIGIDSGLSGAVAAVNSRGEPIACFDMPVMANGKGEATVKQVVNGARLMEKLLILKAKDTQIVVYIERVSSMPDQGVASMFSMGDSFGSIRTAVACAGIPFEFVSSVSWKKHFKLNGLSKVQREVKEFSRTKALELYPSLAELLKRKKDHNRSEALLISCFARDINGKDRR